MEPNTIPNTSHKLKIITLVSLAIVIIFGVLIFVNMRNNASNETAEERAVRDELDNPAPTLTPVTVESVKKELAKPPGGGLSEAEQARIREELSK